MVAGISVGGFEVGLGSLSPGFLVMVGPAVGRAVIGRGVADGVSVSVADAVGSKVTIIRSEASYG